MSYFEFFWGQIHAAHCALNIIHTVHSSSNCLATRVARLNFFVYSSGAAPIIITYRYLRQYRTRSNYPPTLFPHCLFHKLLFLSKIFHGFFWHPQIYNKKKRKYMSSRTFLPLTPTVLTVLYIHSEFNDSKRYIYFSLIL